MPLASYLGPSYPPSVLRNVLLLILPCALAAQAPPHAPAALVRSGDRVVLSYEGRAIFSATIAAQGSVEFRALADTADGAITQVFKWTARGPRARLTLRGAVRGSDEAFAVAAEPREDGLPLAGQSDVVAGDGYALYLTEPAGWRFVEAQADGAEVTGNAREGVLHVVRLRSAAGGRVSWRARFARAG